MDNTKIETVDEKKTKNMLDGKKITKFPFNGRAVNLIDKFLLLGYEQNFIDKYLPKKIEEGIKEIKNKNIAKNILYEYKGLKERPTVLNEITYDYNKELLDNDLISELIFPEEPTIIFILREKNPSNENIEPQGYKVIFSLGPQDNANSKKSYNSFAYVFFRNIENKSINDIKYYIYIPFVLCFISEYPYFCSFSKMCEEIKKKMFFEHSSVPIEILLYNTVKFTPSPIEHSVRLLFGGMLNEGISSENKKITKEILNEQKVPEIFFKQLSGYPIFDINLSVIFNLLPTELIVEVFLFTFLENDILFYSQNLEILNTIMFIFSNLNYPLNDTIYFWHILSVSINNFLSGNSTFVGKTCSTIIGINSSYNPDYLTTQRIKEHFVLDIDNKNFFFVYSEDSEEVRNTMSLHENIKKAIKTKNLDSYSNFDLVYNLNVLYSDLEDISKKVTAINYNVEQQFPGFFKIESSEYEIVQQKNKKIQQIFYSFIINILNNFCKNAISIAGRNESNEREPSVLTTDSFAGGEKKNFIITIKENAENESNELKTIFESKFKDSSKYGTYMINFLLYHDCIDLYKIPLNFTDEFIYWWINLKGKNLKGFNYFELIDSFYIDNEENKKNINNEINNVNGHHKSKDKKDNEVNNDGKKKDDIIVSFETFLNEYEILFRKNINREQLDSKIFSRKAKTPRKLIKYGRKYLQLDDELLMKYIYMLNNSEKEKTDFIKFFPTINSIVNKKINECRLSDISDTIEESLIERKFFSSYCLIKYSLYNILSIMFDLFCVDSNLVNTLTTFSAKTNTKDRKYMVMLSSVFYQLLINKEKSGNKLIILRECIKKLSEYITNNKMLPNEELVDILNAEENSEKIMENDNLKENKEISNKKNDIYLNQRIEYFSSQHFKIRYKKNDKEFKDEKERNYFENDIFALAANNGYNGKFENYKIAFDEDNDIKTRWFDIFSPKKIFLDSKENMKQFLSFLNSENLNKVELLQIVGNQLFYFKILPIEKWTDFNKNKLTDIELLEIIKMISRFYLLLKENIDY